MQPPPIRPQLALRALASVVLVLALAACGTSGSPEGDDGGDDGGPPTDFRWTLFVPTTGDEIKGTTSTISGEAITGTDSVPAGWSIVMSRADGFEALNTYASYDDPASGVTADLTVTIAAPNGASCTVGPAETSVSEDGPSLGDTLSQASYVGVDQTDGRPIVTFAALWGACDELPGASGSGTVDIWMFGFGSP